jgi:hypothetical protein
MQLEDELQPIFFPVSRVLDCVVDLVVKPRTAA